MRIEETAQRKRNKAAGVPIAAPRSRIDYLVSPRRNEADSPTPTEDIENLNGLGRLSSMDLALPVRSSMLNLEKKKTEIQENLLKAAE